MYLSSYGFARGALQLLGIRINRRITMAITLTIIITTTIILMDHGHDAGHDRDHDQGFNILRNTSHPKRRRPEHNSSELQWRCTKQDDQEEGSKQHILRAYEGLKTSGKRSRFLTFRGTGYANHGAQEPGDLRRYHFDPILLG